MPPLKLGELLQQKGLLKESQLEIASAEQAITGERLGETLIGLGFVSSADISQCLAEQAGVPFLDISRYNISEEVLRIVPREMAQNLKFLPLAVEDGALTIGIIDPSNLRAVDKAASLAGKPPKVFMVDTEIFQERLEKAYYFLENPILQGIQKATNIIKRDSSVSGSDVAMLVDYLLQDALRRDATDIHITPTMKSIHVFYRIDGVLQYGHCLPVSAQQGIITRIKVQAKLDIAEQRIPQLGLFSFDFLNRKYSMRVSTIPTIYGEDISLRVLGSSGFMFRITNLGYDEDDVKRLEYLFSKPHGLIIISGPTGGGKTTTLFAALREMDLAEKNVISVEDPIEYRLSMIKQTEVSEKVGYGFSEAGRSFMRHDPDVILVGEMVDEETANITVNASTTGHLVLSTLHTNDAASSIPRLIGFNVDKNTVAATLIAVIGQRLVRKICLGCKTEYSLKPGELSGMEFPEVEGKIKTAFKGSGCSLCNHTGYLGRTAIGEILLVDDDIRSLINSGAPVADLKEKAKEQGLRTIRENGIKKVIEGVTTFEELLRVIG
jgi:type II secretory ATPase GspE/PulE/Tfp pilus assembly ATPase PilB-like protein